jgi:hypothetical protein
MRFLGRLKTRLELRSLTYPASGRHFTEMGIEPDAGLLSLARDRLRAMLVVMGNAPVVACRMRVFQRSRSHTLGIPASRRSFTAGPQFGSFRRVLAHLRIACPAAKPVVIRTSWLPGGTLGECVRRPERFVVRLSDELDEQMAVEVLCHEWAHALAWNFSLDRLAALGSTDPEAFEAEAHGEAWGCAYSRVYRAILSA